MKNTMKRTVSMTMAVVMVMIVMMTTFAIPARADLNSYVGTWECSERRDLGARITVYGDGTVCLYSTKNPGACSSFTYGIDHNGFLSASNGTVFAMSSFNHLVDSNGFHWNRTL